MEPGKIFINDYTYLLPEDRIARYPLPGRGSSKLLIYQQGKISEDTYENIANHIPENSLLVFNNTRVIEARLLFQKRTGGIIEIFCLEPHEDPSQPLYVPGGARFPGERHVPDPVQRLMQTHKVLWRCIIGGASKWKAGQILEKIIKHGNYEIILHARYIEKQADFFIIELSWTPKPLSFAEVLHLAGAIPLPPYIKREVEKDDAKRYQTVYAQHNGSVAAPTAGLHFTESIFKKLEDKNIHCEFVTLHIGAGTFKPVKTETLQQHEMHPEFINVSVSTIKTIMNSLDKNIITVGTTSLRTVETLYWLGVKIKLNPSIEIKNIHLSQWESYELENYHVHIKDALHSLAGWLNKNRLQHLFTKTQLLISPGYKEKIPKALITNFHQPRSTLLLLVAALIGDDWKKVYEYALQHGYRFLSYGDGCLLWISPSTPARREL